MKKFTLLVTLSAFSLAVFAGENTNTPAPTGPPKVYIMMRHGKLIEVNRGKKKLVKKDITLVNLTTIHPNGAIDASSGQSLQLKEGQYMTMDGRIRELKDMVRAAPAKG
ncbi:MAG: hypothetical protein P4L51_03940 [Puia sp.]|nr:hypothetical protein [Puia sp.]